jgi:hypothetical protein
VLSVASSSGVVGDDNDAVSYASGDEGERDGGEAAAATAATRNGDDAPPPAAAAATPAATATAVAATATPAVVPRVVCGRKRPSGRSPMCCVLCVCVCVVKNTGILFNLLVLDNVI